jgi:hypothetical protein
MVTLKIILIFAVLSAAMALVVWWRLKHPMKYGG